MRATNRSATLLRPRSRARRFALALLALALPALPALSSGCCTLMLWEKVPELHAERVLAGSISAEGRLTLAIERSDGERGVYVYDVGGSYTTTLTRVGSWDGTLPASASPIHVVEGDPRHLPDGPFQRTSGALPPRPHQSLLRAPGGPLWVGRSEPGTSIVIVPDLGAGEYWIPSIEDGGETEWTHPGTWGVVVLTPVTAAVDLVTLPFQLVFFYFFWPECC